MRQKPTLLTFETQKAVLEKANDEKKKVAEKHAKSLEGLTVELIRQAGESGQLYGSVTARDIADEINQVAKEKIERNMVDLNQNFKEIGLFPVELTLHPEVKVEVTINIARTTDEAKVQLKTGKAVIADDEADRAAEKAEQQKQAAEKAKENLMDEDALEAEKTAKAEADAKAAEDAEKAAAKAEAKAAKKAEAVAEEEAEESEVTAEAANDEGKEEEKA